MRYRLVAKFIGLVSFAALSALGQDPTPKPLDQETILRLLRDEKPAEVRKAAESLQKSVPKESRAA